MKMVITFAAALALIGCAGEPAVKQPIEFNHQIHVKAEVECLQCHEGLLDAEASRLPTLDTCASCHKAEEAGSNAELQKLAAMVKEDKALEWHPLFNVPDHVFFPHIRHVDGAEYECTECHADMPERTTPPTSARTITMNECIDCHKRNKDRPSAKRAVLDCASCHR